MLEHILLGTGYCAQKILLQKTSHVLGGGMLETQGNVTIKLQWVKENFIHADFLKSETMLLMSSLEKYKKKKFLDLSLSPSNM